MFVPFISKRSDPKLYRRKGGGGKGGGSSGGGKGGSSGGTGGGSGTARSSPISSSGSSKSATSYGSGGGKATTIPSGQLFAGRESGGGTRSQVFGNSQYGSGYPGVAGRGVAGRGFPFIFWPLAWGGIGGLGGAAYYHTTEYGRPDNSSRPGGIMMTAAFTSSSQNTTFRLVADNTTVSSLIDDITANCSSSLSSPSTIVATAYNESLPAPQPEQAVQYYRASSVSLTLDGYNNTGAADPEGTPDTPLPTNIDATLLDCLNQTIGLAVPLVDGASLRWSAPPSMGLVGLAYLLWSLSSII
ncbi:hypothetical protein GALMADRAFT_280747 [Galerina marginata CBS 339.88]|uniref:Uncharacterized protein n=1 Tax=Galerina marginata (strain CBS 339.88) TaxID=685588 RepID=A0A067T3J5_GALM3|nr:hypothetical protein GALMADRAFT_280747 [Galerina marginata CBS 339.88]